MCLSSSLTNSTEDFYHREIDLRQETFCVTVNKWIEDMMGVAAKGKEKKLMCDKNICFIMAGNSMIGSLIKKILWRTWTVAYFETL